MRKDWKYILYVLGAVGVYILVRLLSPQQYDWSVTFAYNDKNPYGTFAFHELLPQLFEGKEILHSYKTLYELKDSIRNNDNIFIVCTNFKSGNEDVRVLLDHVANGGMAFISAQYFWGHFADTLSLNTRDYFFNSNDFNIRKDTSYLTIANPNLDSTRKFRFRRDNIHSYFDKFDTTRTTVVAKNEDHRPVTIRIAWGKGNLILNSTPLVFSNINMLAKENHHLVSGMLSYLPSSGNIYRTEYYHLGRMEARTPLRFILTNEALSWAYYLTLFSILLFMLFEARRKQRIIPVMKPLSNTSLEFVSTIGNLYYQNSDHKNLAEKKISFLMEQIRTKYMLKTSAMNEAFFEALASKSGNTPESVHELFRTIAFIQSSTMISAGQLVDLNDKIERFNHQDNF